MYDFKSNVRYSETGEDGRLTIGSAINYMQDCTTFHSSSIDLGVEKLIGMNRAWILNAWHIIVDDLPKFNTEIIVSTWAESFKSFMGYRNFTIHSADGTSYMKANSLWVYVDMRTGKPVKPTIDEIAPYGEGEKLDLGEFGRKVKLPEDMVELEPVAIRKDQIDTNSHVNNCEYVKMALEYIPDDVKVKEIDVEYRNPSFYGMKLVPRVKREDSYIYVSLSDESGKLCSALRFKF